MLIRNATAYVDTRFHTHTDVRLEQGVVAEIGSNLNPVDEEEVVEAEGKYLLPGFVDVHIHACKGHDTMRGEADIRAMSRDLHTFGVAAFLPTTMSGSVEDTRHAIAGVRQVMDHPEKQGAKVLGAHMEAPFLADSKCGAQLVQYFTDPSMERLTALTGGDLNAVKMITIAPERQGTEAFILAATAHGIHVSIGHTDATAEQVHQAADWGSDHVTHTFNAQSPLHHRKPGVPGAALTDDRLYCEMICDGVHLHPDIIRLLHRAKGAEKAVMITDAMEAAGMPDGEYELGGQKVFVHGAEARLASGTLAGSVLTMPRALRNMICRFGIPAEDAVRMCTLTPAESIGEEKAGRIALGSPAVLTLWDQAWDQMTVVSQ